MLPTARKNNLLVEDVGEEVVVYDQERYRAHCLNRTAAMVWNNCNGQRTPEEIAAILQQELNPLADTDLVLLSLDRLEAAHLLQDPVERPTDQKRLSRRRFVRRVGTVGLLSLLLPAVQSIVAPTPAFAQSEIVSACGIGVGRCGGRGGEPA
jgi:hypothetical protein